MSEERIVRRKLSDLRKGNTNWVNVEKMTDEEIDEAALSDPDAQPTDAEFWQNAEVVIPTKEFQHYLRVDPDVLEWFRSRRSDYKARMNSVLREYLQSHGPEDSTR